MITVGRRFNFSMAHLLPNHKGACKRLHGHNYVLEVVVAGNRDAHGMLIDFSDLKRIVQENVLDVFDHKTLLMEGDLATLRMESLDALQGMLVRVTYPPTAENMLGQHIVPLLHRALLALAEKTATQVSLRSVRLYETDGCWAEWLA